MKVKDLNGKTYSWNLALYINNERAGCSNLHARARKLLRDIYPCEPILEEVQLPGTRLTGDFYIHSQRLMIEVNGEQHYKANGFFHNEKLDFYRGKTRDRKKQEWCDLNGITLISLPYDEDDDEWKRRIKIDS